MRPVQFLNWDLWIQPNKDVSINVTIQLTVYIRLPQDEIHHLQRNFQQWWTILTFSKESHTSNHLAQLLLFQTAPNQELLLFQTVFKLWIATFSSIHQLWSTPFSNSHKPKTTTQLLFQAVVNLKPQLATFFKQLLLIVLQFYFFKN